MTYLTINIPDKTTVDILSKLCEDDLKQLTKELRAGNFGKIKTAAESALKKVNEK